MYLTVCSCHVTYAFQSELTLYSCLNAKEFLARSWHKTWCLSDCNWNQTHNHLVHQQTLKHLAKLAKWCCEDLLVWCIWLYVFQSKSTLRELQSAVSPWNAYVTWQEHAATYIFFLYILLAQYLIQTSMEMFKNMTCLGCSL